MRIYKYRVDFDCEIELPQGFQIVDFREQGYMGIKPRLYIWALVNENQPMSKEVFMIVGTGQAFPEGFTYRRTCHEGDYVWHLLEKTNEK